MEIAGREVRTVRRMVQYIPLEFFQKRSSDVRGMGPRVVVEQAHAAWQHSPSFVLNGSSNPCQGVIICSGINCCAKRYEIDQENVFSVPENGRFDFFSLKLKFWMFWFWGNAYGAIAMALAWIQGCGEKPMFHLQSQWNPETHLLLVRSAWETTARNPSVSFCDRPLIFWAPSVRTIFYTLIFLSQLHELLSWTLREWCDATLLSSRVDFSKFLLQFLEEGRQRSNLAYRSFVRREHQSFLRRIHGTTSSHFADSQLYNKLQKLICEFPLDVHILRRGNVWRNAPRIWRDFGSTLPFQTRLTQTKPILPLSNEQGSQVKDQDRWQCCHNKHKNFHIGLHVIYLYFPDTPRITHPM